MPAYICVTHALSRREETDVFCRGLSRYGFRFACIHEQTDPQHRDETLSEASLLIALTCPAAETAETEEVIETEEVEDTHDSFRDSETAD